MALYIQIGLLVLILASLVIAYFSARTWHWGQVLVVLGIFLSTLGFFVLAAETLRINAILRKEVNRLTGELVTFQAQNDALEKGTNDANIINQLRAKEVRIPEEAESIPSLAELEHRLLLATRNRGRAWRNVAPAGFDPQTGAVRVGVEQPVPAGFQPQSVVVLFEAGEPQLPQQPGAPPSKQYLGEFRVVQAEGQTATLQPVLPLDNFERQRLANGRGPWIVYDTMPADRHSIFANMSEDQLKQKLPPQSANEYIRHGKPASADDDETRVVGYDENDKRLPPDQVNRAPKKLYQRRLRDYSIEFEELARRRLALTVDIDALREDKQRLATALTSANKLQTFREDEIQKLNTDLAGVSRERQAIERHLGQVQHMLGRGRQLLAETLQRNSELARQLAGRRGPSRGASLSPAATQRLALDSVH